MVMFSSVETKKNGYVFFGGNASVFYYFLVKKPNKDVCLGLNLDLGLCFSVNFDCAFVSPSFT